MAMFLLDSFREGGPFMYLVLLLSMVGAVVGLTLAIVALLGKWTPAAGWLALPVGVVLAGSVGTLSGAGLALAAVATAAPSEASMMAAMGWSIAQLTDVFGSSAGASLLGATAFFGGVAHAIGVGKEARPSLGIGLATIGLALLAGAGLLVAGLMMHAGPIPMSIGAFASMAGIGLGIASLRIHEGDDGRERAAATRAFLGACGIGSVLLLGAAGKASGGALVYEALSSSRAELRLAMWANGENIASAASLAGWIAAGTLAVITLVPLLPVAGALKARRTLISGALAVLLVAPVVGVRAVTGAQLEELSDLTDVGLYDALQGHLTPIPTDYTPDGIRSDVQEGLSRPILELGDQGWGRIEVPSGQTGAATLPITHRRPTLVVPARTPAGRLLETALSDTGEVQLLARWRETEPPTEDADPRSLGLSVVRLRLLRETPPRQEVDAPYVLIENPDSSLDDTARRLVDGATSGYWSHVLLIPGDGWTVQDVVTLCLAAASLDVGDWNDRGLPCALAEAPPAVERPVEASLEDLLGAGQPEPGSAPSVDTGESIVLGSLDRAVIDRVVRQHLAQIRYCYQRELRTSQALSGKLIVKFVIAEDGTVQSSTTKPGSTLNNDATESCIHQRFMQMRFPAPQGGGIVIVAYPFVFQAE